ncbi:hypothetical protein F2Q69_00054632 [Brassica cretica]|uniref:Uncharacterized protein n=1 Tax=Brassica cretica TaxID=69181 RepID=A0A8S9MVZ0_BRACR|nr:hypothetical protein F2Q69_00054632 [Brassica cretica]
MRSISRPISVGVPSLPEVDQTEAQLSFHLVSSPWIVIKAVLGFRKEGADTKAVAMVSSGEDEVVGGRSS